MQHASSPMQHHPRLSTAVHPKEMMFSCAEAGLTVHAQGVQERRPLTGSRLWLGRPDQGLLLGRPDQPLLLLLVRELALELLVWVRVRVRVKARAGLGLALTLAQP